MSDKGSELLKQALGEEQTPLSEQQRETARKACAFAMVAFSSQWEGEWLNEWLEKRNVPLTQEQLGFAKSLRDVFPEPDEVLPKTEFDSAYSGYYHLSSTPIGELIPTLLGDENKTFGPNPDYEIATELFKEDPTGIAYLQRLLSNIEEKATISSIELKGKEDDVRTKIAAILAAAKDVPDEPKPQKPLDDRTVNDAVLDAFMATFGGNRTQREEFIENARVALREETPMEIGENGKLLPTDSLKVLGARLAFDRWQTGVNAYMNRWGNQTQAA